MMLQKALKMDHGESYLDVISDLKFMDGNINMLEMSMPYAVSHAAGLPHVDGNSPWKSGYLTMMPTVPNNANQSQGGSSNMNFNPMPHSLSSFIQGINPTYSPSQSSSSKPASETSAMNQKPGTSTSQTSKESKEESDLRLLLSPWQQIMYQPPQMSVVIDRIHSGARRFVVLDFGSPILLTDFVIPACAELVSLSIDVWINREEIDGQRLVVCSDIGQRSLAVSDLHPAVLCRYLKVNKLSSHSAR